MIVASFHDFGNLPFIQISLPDGSTPSLPSHPGPLWPGVIAPDKGPIYGLNRTKPWFFDFTVFCI